MNVKVTGIALATLMACTLIQPGYAMEPKANQVDQAGVTMDGVNQLIQAIEAEVSAASAAVREMEHPEGIGIYLDGVALLQVEREKYKENCYVTVESFAQAVDTQTQVVEEEGAVTLTSQTETGEETLALYAEDGACYLVANDRYLYVPTGVTLIDGQVAAPIQTLAEVYNLTVNVDEETDYIRLFHQEDMGAYLIPGSSYYDSDDLYWLSHIINAESGNQPLVGKMAVGNVVMNRVASSRYPNSIYGVVFQTNQFSPAASGSIYNSPNQSSILAAKLVLDGGVVLHNALFFNGAGLRSYASCNRPYVTTIGGHDFYA